MLVHSCLLLYLFFAISIHLRLCSNNLPQESSSCLSGSSFHHYQPIPISSIWSSCDKLPHTLLFNTSFVSQGLQCYALPKRVTCYFHSRCSRHVHFLVTLLLILAGDVSLNPGPTVQQYGSQSLNFCHLNIRSASSITTDLNKPAVLQDFIATENIDILALSETWLSVDSSPSV